MFVMDTELADWINFVITLNQVKSDVWDPADWAMESARHSTSLVFVAPTDIYFLVAPTRCRPKGN